jgi:hypothetical protein
MDRQHLGPGQFNRLARPLYADTIANDLHLVRPDGPPILQEDDILGGTDSWQEAEGSSRNQNRKAET